MGRGSLCRVVRSDYTYRHFITLDVRAMGLKLFRRHSVGVVGAGIMLANFREAGTVVWDKGRIKILVGISKSSSAHLSRYSVRTGSLPQIL